MDHGNRTSITAQSEQLPTCTATIDERRFSLFSAGQRQSPSSRRRNRHQRLMIWEFCDAAGMHYSQPPHRRIHNKMPASKIGTGLNASEQSARSLDQRFLLIVFGPLVAVSVGVHTS